MYGNSNNIGPKKATSTTVSSGVYDLFDQYSSRRNSSWPITISIDSLSFNSGTIYENTSQSITVNSSGIVTNTTYYWTVLHGSTTSSDFYGSTVSGSFTISSATQQGSFSLITAFIGNTSKTTKTFQIQIRKDSTLGDVVYTSGTYSIPAITSSVYWSTSAVNEDQSTFYLYTYLSNIGTYTTYTANISYGGTAASGDFVSARATTMTIGSGTYSVSYQALTDLTTEGSETVTATVTYSAYTIGTTGTLTINDTSTAVTASVTPGASSINEGSAVTFNVTTTGMTSGTLYWTLDYTGATAADFSATSGSFTVTSNSGSFSVTPTADSLTEAGAESFTASIRTVSTSGSIIATSTSVTINDTSQGGGIVNNPTSTTFSVPGRASYYWNQPISNTTYVIPTGWTYTFPANTPIGWFYLVLWNDYSTGNTSPTASTSYRTRRVFSLQVVSSYDYANRVPCAASLSTITGSGSYERIQGIVITNTTRSQVMANVIPGSAADVQYHSAAYTVMVVPGDTITMSVLLQGPYGEYANWTHNAV